ncbi:T9SS type A sorting domain-containing protein [Planktosalinus lacus]|uniref:Fibronectin type-III domain-containing protein n=1 Tax=Planktosalinus lacus TaxID=1526573 RepID=A0A8J2VAM4_9FLAO|nr:T9SS type A sorting domain-containing protein [Planktosalinus lacus]GGD92187.1 hypothetical protein GCM10011312_14960 [Planktosalinus lacus]
MRPNYSHPNSAFRFLYLLIFFTILNVNAQNQGKIWYFGANAGLDFNTTPPTALLDGQLNTLEGAASISDENGELLFYTDGLGIYTKNHTLMPNGVNGLGGDFSSSQSALIIPHPGNESQYILFAVSAYTVSNVAYSVIDMDLNNGLGDVVQGMKAISVLNGTGEYLQATKSADGTFWWVLTHKSGSSKYYAYKLTAAGVDIENPVISNTGSSTSGFGDIGFIKFSNSGNKIVRTGYISNIFDVSDFDPGSGVVSNTLMFSSPSAYGAEFSPNGQFLYIAAYGPQGVNQFDLQGGTTMSEIAATQYNYSNLANGTLLSAPDGKIYSSRHGATALDVIHFPNLPEAQANYEQNAVNLGGKTAQLGLINIVADFVSQGPPQLSDLNAFSISEDEAQLSVEINSDGGASITQRGFEFGTSPSNLQEYLVSGETGNMQLAFENLMPNTQYFYTAFAENNHGRTTLEVQNFITLNEIDDTPPVAICVESLTVQLDEFGMATIDESMIDNGSFDDVEIDSIVLDVYEFTCNELGEQLVMLTVTDTSGNSSTCTTTVIVEDNQAPVIEYSENQNFQFIIEAPQYTLPNFFEEGIFLASDACTDPLSNLNQSPEPHTILLSGIHQITLTAADDSNNVSNYTFEIEIGQTLSNVENDAFENLYLYPNPARNVTNINKPSGLEINSVDIYEINGRLVKTILFKNISENNTLDISNLASATYLVVLKNDFDQTVKQLIVK